LEQFSGELEKLGLYEVVRATYNEIEVSLPNFYYIFKVYCPSIRTFFTLVGELGLALHEMWEVTKLPMSFLLYEEYFPFTEELKQLGSQDAAMYETYRELMCHFQICLNVYNIRGNVNGG